MDPREHYDDTHEAMQTAVESQAVRIWTALPGIVTKVNLGAATVEVQPAIQSIRIDMQTQQMTYINLPIVPDVPIVFPHGGGFTLTFPIKAGDECLLVFASRNIDNWWQQGGVQKPWDRRTHDLSDAFAIMGPMSQAKKIGGISATGVQLRSDAGTDYVEVDAGSMKLFTTGTLTVTAPTINFVAATSISMQAPTVNWAGAGGAKGSMIINADIGTIGTLTNNSVNVSSSHKHGGVQSGGATTGTPQ